jgi:hypothetical protein
MGVTEQSHRAVLAVVNDGASLTDVARRFGVSGVPDIGVAVVARQTVSV